MGMRFWDTRFQDMQYQDMQYQDMQYQDMQCQDMQCQDMLQYTRDEGLSGHGSRPSQKDGGSGRPTGSSATGSSPSMPV